MLIPDMSPCRMVGVGKFWRWWMDSRPISLLVRLWLTKASTGSRPERVTGHIGTEIRPRLLREAAVGNIAQWAEA